MEVKRYHYPESIQSAKARTKLAIIFLPLLLILVVFRFIPLKPVSLSDYYLLIIGLLFGILGSVFFVGWWADIVVEEDSIFIEFLWMYLKVKWDDIADVTPFGPRFMHLWVVTTKNNLTPFHRLYGMFSAKSFLPSFYITILTKSHALLLAEVKSQINLHRGN